MADRRQYWPLETGQQDRGYRLELRSNLAWDLIHHFGSVAADIGGEDTAGRAKLRLQTSDELVARCFAIADAFVTQSEARSEIQGYDITEEEAYQKAGRMAKLRSRAEFDMQDMPKVEMSTEEVQMRSRHAAERAELRRKQTEAENKPK